MLFGTPTRFGNVASQLKAFIDATGPLWARRAGGKVYSAFTASNTAHGGQEATLLALGNVFYHWGGIIVPPGYTDPVQFKSGNPYGTVISGHHRARLRVSAARQARSASSVNGPGNTDTSRSTRRSGSSSSLVAPLDRRRQRPCVPCRPVPGGEQREPVIEAIE